MERSGSAYDFIYTIDGDKTLGSHVLAICVWSHHDNPGAKQTSGIRQYVWTANKARFI
jgi:hypothetical protein